MDGMTATGETKAGDGAATRRRMRAVVFAFVGIGAALGWAWLVAMVAAMIAATDMSALGPGMGLLNRINGFADLSPEMRAGLAALCGPVTSVWSAADWATVAAMWVAMVAAMMLPSAAPVLTAYADMGAERVARGETMVSPVVLGLGYLAVWLGFAALATAAQGALTTARLLTPAGVPVSQVLGGTTMIAAGLYQFTPLKLACLSRCRAPRPFFADHWSDRVGGVFRMGVAQGVDCMGCCWALMVAMFAVGVMNVVWIALFGVISTVEKLLPSAWISRVVGAILIAWGLATLASSPIGAVWLGRG